MDKEEILEQWKNAGPFPGSIGGTFPSEPKPTTCYICGKPSVRSEQSLMGQLLFGLCEEHKNYHAYMEFGQDGPLGGNTSMGLMKSKKGK